jgi:sterol desaturase/sphingolipid hydroxylase (fatty acid hydroxylase superfamily)
MGKDQDSNWCVTFPLFDYILGTRRKYVGTDEERADLLKRELKLKEQGSVRVLTRIDRRSVG